MKLINNLKALHKDRSLVRVSLYFVLLLTLLPFSLIFQALANACEYIIEMEERFDEFFGIVTDIVKKWAFKTK